MTLKTSRPSSLMNNLYNEMTFYPALISDMLKAKSEIVIYSPFVSHYRSDTFNRIMHKCKDGDVSIFIFTRSLDEYDPIQRRCAAAVLSRYEEMGACVYYLNGAIHQKVAIIDREILWEGSLNILSQRASREMMRRITAEGSAKEVMSYLKLTSLLADGYRAKYQRLANGDQRNRKITIQKIVLGFMVMTAVWWIINIIFGMMPLNALLMLIVTLFKIPY